MVNRRVTLTSDVSWLRTLRVFVLKAEFLHHLLEGPWSEPSHMVLQVYKAILLRWSQACFRIQDAHLIYKSVMKLCAVV